MSTPSILLGLLSNSTGSVTETIELCGTSASDPYTVDFDGVQDPGPSKHQAWASSPWRDGAELSEEAYDNRTVVIPLTVQGTTTGALEAAWVRLGRFVQRVHALSNHRREQHETVPVLVRSLGESNPLRYFPLTATLEFAGSAATGGMIPPELIVDANGLRLLRAKLTLTCRYYLESPPLLAAVTSTAINGTSSGSLPSVLDFPYVACDLPPRLRVVLQDTSVPGVNTLNRARLSVVGQAALPAGANLSDVRWNWDWGLPSNVVLSGGSFTNSTGTWTTPSDAQSLASSGKLIHFVPAATSFDYTTVATLNMSTNVLANSGTFIPFVRVRDSSALPSPSITTWSYLVYGSLVKGSTYTYVVSAVNGSGETAASSPVALYLSTARRYQSLRLSWLPVNGATGYRLYRSSTFGATWDGFFSTSGTTFTDTGGTPSSGSPLSSSTATVQGSLSQYRLLAGHLNDVADNMQVVGSNTTAIGSSFELVRFPPVTLPPGRLPSGYTSAGWQLQLQARRASSFSGSIDIDQVYLFPLHGSYAEAVFNTLTSNTEGQWIIEQGLDDTVSAVLADYVTGLTAYSSLLADGDLSGQPGRNRLFVNCHGVNDIHQVGVSYTISGLIWPRWLHFRG